MKQVFYVPDRGDVVWITLPPPRTSTGRRSGRRPAVVLSPQAYNARVGLALLCPITPHIKRYPFEVPLPSGLPVDGAILADRAESLDWRAYRAERICSLSPEVVQEALGKLRALLT
jgi:mRNA interferase MazF